MKKLSLALLLLGSTAYSFNLEKPKKYSIRAIYDYGRIKGFVQIPKGGKYGTTSDTRPTFHELGIENVGFPELSFQAEWDNLLFYTEFRGKYFKGDGKLSEILITHSKFIPENSNIDTKHMYLEYNFGIGYNISKIKNFRFSPLLEVGANTFEYKYSATTPINQSVSSKRHFDWGHINLGFKSSYQFTPKYSLEINGKFGIPFNNIRRYCRLELLNTYEFYKNVKFLLGIEYNNLKFRDWQKQKQNYMKHEMFPVLKVGLEYSF